MNPLQKKEKEKEKVILDLQETNYDIFNALILDQFEYGGKKYAGSEERPTREATDDLFDDFSYLWLLGTNAKYVKRFTNLARERDLLKIACYQYIIWLKRGFHVTPQGTPEIIDTNVKIKSQFFNSFIEATNAYEDIVGGEDIFDIYKLTKSIVDENLNSSIQNNIVSNNLKEVIQNGFFKVTENNLIYLYKTCFNIWDKKFSNQAGTDTDTYNEKG